MRKLKKKELLLISLWLIIILGVVGDFAFRSVFVKFGRLDEEISLSEEKLLRLKAIAKQEKGLERGYRNLFAGYKDIKNSDKLLQEIQNVAKQADATILNIKPVSEKDEGLYKIYSIKIESQDEIQFIVKFIQALSQELKGVGIQRLQIAAKEKQELPRATLVINAVVFKE